MKYGVLLQSVVIKSTSYWCFPVLYPTIGVKYKLCLIKMNPIYLYHGSKVLVDELIPNQAYGFGGEADCFKAVYAVERKVLAIPFCFKLVNISNNSSFNIDTDKEIPEITLKNCEIDWEHKGYLYKVKSNNFVNIDSLQWTSKAIVKPVEITVIDPNEYRAWVKYCDV